MSEIAPSDEALNSVTPNLSDLSQRDKPWDKHRGNADVVSGYYAGSEFQDYSNRVHDCSELLDFKLVPDESEGMLKLKLNTARFCRVRHCPVCQWRRSLMWKAKAYKILPRIVEDYPKYRWLFVTLTVRNFDILPRLKADGIPGITPWVFSFFDTPYNYLSLRQYLDLITVNKPMNEPNLNSPRGLHLQRLTRIFNLALPCAPRYVYSTKIFVFLDVRILSVH